MALVGKVRWSFRREVVLNNRKGRRIKHNVSVTAPPGLPRLSGTRAAASRQEHAASGQASCRLCYAGTRR